MRVAVAAHAEKRLGGGDRSKVKAFKIKVEAGALSVCVPAHDEEAN